MAPRKPKINCPVEPDPSRIQTRPKNATTHPGRIINETLVVRRTAEEIEDEKNAKEERRQARKQKIANLEAAAVDIAEYENKMAVDDAGEVARFPRSKPKEDNPFNLKANGKKRKGKTTSSSSGAGHKKETGKSSATLSKKRVEPTSDLDPTEGEETEVDQREMKRSKMSKCRIRPTLRRTETYIVVSSENSDVEMEDVPVSAGTETETEENKTPKPKKKDVHKRKGDDSGSGSDSKESENFQTPRALKKRAAKRADSDLESLAESDVNPMDMSKADPQTDGRTESESEGVHSSVAQTHQHNKGPKGKKDKRAFRKGVEERRIKVVKSVAPAPQPNHPVTSKSQTVNSKSGKITSSRAAEEPTLTQKGGTLSRTSATSSNNVGVSRITSAITSKQKKSKAKFDSRSESDDVEITSIRNLNQSKSKSKPKSTIMENTGGLSDCEDDSVERDSILKSPPKGGKRLSSVAVVTIVEKPRSSSNKSRSKESILGREVVPGWSKSVEPIFIYFYYYELSPWPTTADIGLCAQPIWDWRFGDAHPLKIAESPQHLQLLNQKLCDIRNQAASIALGHVDEDFRTNNDISAGFTQTEITKLRGQYARTCLNDKKFLFGKYTISNGNTRKALPYQSKVILQTFGYLFKYIKDTNLNGNSPLSSLPEPRYPKTALAIAIAAVERALTLSVHGDYDFVTNKLVPKPDPSHPTKPLSTNMFAFSEGSWKGRVEFYLEKGISKLKEKDWTNIMKGAAEHSTFILKSTASSASALEPTEEELEMEWESDEDVDPAT